MVDQGNEVCTPLLPEIRQSLVDTAVEFLNMTKIHSQPEEKKRQFLTKKGLTSAEIEMAFKKSSSQSHNLNPNYYDVEAQNYVPQRQILPLPPPFSVPFRAPRTIWTVLRDSFNMLMYMSGVVAIFNYFYKYYIYPFLTGKKQKSKEEVLLEVQTSVMEVLKHLESTIDKINSNVLIQNEKLVERETSKSSEPLYIDDLKTELSTIKSLLINKKTFPAPPALSFSIPEWQKRSKPPVENNAKEEDPLKHIGNQTEKDSHKHIKENEIEDLKENSSEHSKEVHTNGETMEPHSDSV